jgi:hypothetical protein
MDARLVDYMAVCICKKRVWSHIGILCVRVVADLKTVSQYTSVRT